MLRPNSRYYATGTDRQPYTGQGVLLDCHCHNVGDLLNVSLSQKQYRAGRAGRPLSDPHLEGTVFDAEGHAARLNSAPGLIANTPEFGQVIILAQSAKFGSLDNQEEPPACGIAGGKAVIDRHLHLGAKARDLAVGQLGSKQSLSRQVDRRDHRRQRDICRPLRRRRILGGERWQIGVEGRRHRLELSGPPPRPDGKAAQHQDQCSHRNTTSDYQGEDRGVAVLLARPPAWPGPLRDFVLLVPDYLLGRTWGSLNPLIVFCANDKDLRARLATDPLAPHRVGEPVASVATGAGGGNRHDELLNRRSSDAIRTPLVNSRCPSAVRQRDSPSQRHNTLKYNALRY